MPNPDKCYVIVTAVSNAPKKAFLNPEHAWDYVRKEAFKTSLTTLERCMTVVEIDLQ